MITIIPENNVQAPSAVVNEFDIRIMESVGVNGHSGTTQINMKSVPKSFWKGLSDCDSGRVIDMDRAMNEPPPSVN